MDFINPPEMEKGTMVCSIKNCLNDDVIQACKERMTANLTVSEGIIIGIIGILIGLVLCWIFKKIKEKIKA